MDCKFYTKLLHPHVSSSGIKVISFVVFVSGGFLFVCFQPLSVPLLAAHDVLLFCNVPTCLKIGKLSDGDYLEAILQTLVPQLLNVCLKGKRRKETTQFCKIRPFLILRTN